LYGELYDPKKYIDCVDKKPEDTGCDRYKLKRRAEPEYWPGGVRSINIPAPQQTVRYQPGMSAKQYFDQLCSAEAGEFIYKTVESVEAIYQIRPRLVATTYELQDRYVMEDPYGYTNSEASEAAKIFVDPPNGAFRVFETPKTKQPELNSLLFERHAGYYGRRENGQLVQKPMVIELTRSLKSTYGFTWRGIKRHLDRENGIAGGELIVVDMRTGEVLGVRRGFIYSAATKPKPVNWEVWSVCPEFRDHPGWPKRDDFANWFVSKVVKPSPTAK
jgi:hypothetical protein